MSSLKVNQYWIIVKYTFYQNQFYAVCHVFISKRGCTGVVPKQILDVWHFSHNNGKLLIKSWKQCIWKTNLSEVFIVNEWKLFLWVLIEKQFFFCMNKLLLSNKYIFVRHIRGIAYHNNTSYFVPLQQFFDLKYFFTRISLKNNRYLRIDPTKISIFMV